MARFESEEDDHEYRVLATKEFKKQYSSSHEYEYEIQVRYLAFNLRMSKPKNVFEKNQEENAEGEDEEEEITVLSAKPVIDTTDTEDDDYEDDEDKQARVLYDDDHNNGLNKEDDVFKSVKSFRNMKGNEQFQAAKLKLANLRKPPKQKKTKQLSKRQQKNERRRKKLQQKTNGADQDNNNEAKNDNGENDEDKNDDRGNDDVDVQSKNDNDTAKKTTAQNRITGTRKPVPYIPPKDQQTKKDLEAIAQYDPRSNKEKRRDERREAMQDMKLAPMVDNVMSSVTDKSFQGENKQQTINR